MNYIKSMVSLGIGIVLIIFMTLEFAALGKSGEELTLRLRDKAFRQGSDRSVPSNKF